MFLVVACALYTQFTAFSTPSSHWIGFQVIQGFAGGFGMQFATLATQLELKDRQELVPLGIALVMFVQYLGATILQTIAGVIFNRVLREQLTVHAGLVEAEVAMLLAGGIRSLRAISEQHFPDKLEHVLEAYNSAITRVFVSFFVSSRRFSLPALLTRIFFSLDSLSRREPPCWRSPLPLASSGTLLRGPRSRGQSFNRVRTRREEA